MPFGEYKDFDDCVRKNSDKKDPKAYCATIERKVKESTMEEAVKEQLHDVFPVQEAIFNDDEMTANVTIIREGLNMSRPRKNYTKSALQQAVREGIFNNLRMFADHSDKPPIRRSIKELVSGTGITTYEEGSDGMGMIKAPVKFFNKDFYEFAKHAHEHMGTSISALVRGVRFRATDGVVQEDVHGFVPQAKHQSSVDWVVFPSAGGKIDSFIAHEGVDVEDIEWENITPEMLNEHAPDLVKQIQAAAPKTTPVKESVTQDPPSDDEEKFTKDEVKSFVAQAVKEAIDDVETKRSNQKAVAGQVAALVDAAPLPARTKARIKSSFDGAEKFEEASVKEAISDAQAELKEVAGPRVTGMGVTRSDGDGKEFVGPAREAVEGFFLGEKKPEKVAAAATPSSTGTEGK